MKKRYTLSTGPLCQKQLAKLARKLSLETHTPWTAQDVVKRCVQIGLTHSMGAYYPSEKPASIDS
jgi:hypothetical protein